MISVIFEDIKFIYYPGIILNYYIFLRFFETRFIFELWQSNKIQFQIVQLLQRINAFRERVKRRDQANDMKSVSTLLIRWSRYFRGGVIRGRVIADK